MNEIDGYTARVQRREGADGRLKRGGRIIVTQPVFVQITENIKGVCVASVYPQKLGEALDDVRPRAIKMQIGDKQRRSHTPRNCYSTTLTLSIITGSRGTF